MLLEGDLKKGIPEGHIKGDFKGHLNGVLELRGDSKGDFRWDLESKNSQFYVTKSPLFYQRQFKDRKWQEIVSG